MTQGEIVDSSEPPQFSRFSKAPVDRIVAPTACCTGAPARASSPASRTSSGQSGPFLIREVYEGSDGQQRYLILPEDET